MSITDNPDKAGNIGMLVGAYLSPVILLFLGVAITIPTIVVYGTNIPIIPAFLLSVVMQILTGFILLWASGKLKNIKQTLRLQNFKIKTFAYSAAIAGGIFFGLLLLNVILSQFGIEGSNSETTDSFNSIDGIWRYVALILFVSMLGPIVEELFFRGIILSHLLQGHGVLGEGIKNGRVIISIVFVSTFFALMHFQGFSEPMDFIVLLSSFIFSVAVSVLTIKTNSIYPAIVTHMLYNFLGALTLMLT